MRISSGIILLSLLSFNSACGKWAKANSEQVVTMQRPEYPDVSGDVFSLNSPKTYTNYRGTLFLANDNATPVDFAALINASVESREAWAAMKKFEVETDFDRVYNENSGLVGKQIELMKEGLQAFELEALSKNPISFAAKYENATTWIDREVASIGLTPEAKAAFDTSWGEYCEAKVIELAAHPALAQNLFKSQPSPTPLCQKYYADHAILTSPDCTSETGDYMKCIWLDGVAKTRWFTSPNEATNPDLARAKEEKRLKLNDLLSDVNYEATKGIFGFVESSFILTSVVNKKLYFDKKEAFLNIALDQKNDATCVKVVANVGSQDLCRVFGLSPETRSPRQIINAVEGVTNDAKIFAKLPAPPGRTITTQQLIRYLNERSRSETSEGDRLFLELKNGSNFASPTFTSAGKEFTDMLPEFRGILGAEFYGAFSPADQAERTAKVNAITFEENKVQELRAEHLRLNEVIAASTDNGVTVGNRPGFGHAFLQYNMIYQQFGNILSAQLNFVNYEKFAFRACYDLENRAQIACPADLPLKADTTFLDAVLNRATDGGMIEFSFKIENAEAIGLGPKVRAEAGLKPDFFMDLPTTELEGRTLRFELYRNRLDGYLDIMTGKAFVEENGQRRYEAGISMWEQAE
ncbi:MAG: hypothetical protein EOP07_03260 [Proteobacteria bacterium]|nr:MAG: hypothetical protein EOP07_03260 [Pseudomonadota bacterium]